MKLLNAILLFCYLALTSCNIFSTRDAESPNENKGNFEPAVNPETVTTNLINSLKDKNVQNYIQCLIDSSFSRRNFVFIPAGGTIIQSGESWTKKSEEQYFVNMIVKLSENRYPLLELTNENYSAPQGDSIIYTAAYSLTVPHEDTNLPTFFQGSIKLTLVRDSRSIWSIAVWQDVKNSNNKTWSDLKAWFYL